MERIERNLQTGEVTTVPLTAEEIAEREVYERDVLPGEIRQRIRQQRAAAYAAESDPIFFKAQRGEATMDDWRTAVAAIQLSFPYPDEEVTP